MGNSASSLELMRSDLSQLYDVEFKVKSDNSEGIIIKAHKLILSTKSGVFRRWFYDEGSLKESKVIEINDVKHIYFSKMIDFIYQNPDSPEDEDDWTIRKILELYTTFQTYEIQDGLDALCDSISSVRMPGENLESELMPLCEVIRTSTDSSLKMALGRFLMNHNDRIMRECTLADLDPEAACYIFAAMFESKKFSPEVCLEKIESFFEKKSENDLENLRLAMLPAINMINWKEAKLETILNVRIFDDTEKVAKLIEHFGITPDSSEPIIIETHNGHHTSALTKNVEMQFLKGCQSNFEALYNDSETKDCEFKFSNGQIMKAHKTVLAMSSKVFHAMFYGPMKELGQIQITDVEYSVFEMLVQMMYYQNVDKISTVSSEILSHLYAALHKYEFQTGLEFLKPFILTRTKDMFLFLELAQMFSDSELEAECLKILKEPLVAMNSEYYLSAKPETINKVFNQPGVQIGSDEKLNRALECYVEANLHKDPDFRKEINGSIKRINFLEVNQTSILRSKLLTNEEKIIKFAGKTGLILKVNDSGRGIYTKITAKPVWKLK